MWHSISRFVSQQISRHTTDNTSSTADVRPHPRPLCLCLCLSVHTHTHTQTHTHIHTHARARTSRMDARSHCWTLPFAKSEKPINDQIYYAVLSLGDSARTADTGIAVRVRQNGASNVSIFQCARQLFG